MGRKIVIRSGDLEVSAELNDSSAAEALFKVLPFSAEAVTWGDEIYFPVPVDLQLDATARELVQVGDLGYWPPGHAFCIFFGPTPISRGDEIRPAGPVNIVGRIIGEPRAFKAVRDGDPIELDVAP
jgi:hypothetical protein